MRWLLVSLFLMPTLVLAKQLMLTIPTNYPLNIANTEYICSALHANLSANALNQLDTLSNMPFTCKQNPNNLKELMVIFTLKKPST